MNDLLDLSGLVIPTVTNTLFPPLSDSTAEELDQILFLDDNASGLRLTKRHLMQTSHALAKGFRDNRGVAYLWAPFRKGDSIGIVLPGLAQKTSGLPLGWEWSLLEFVMASIGVLKAGGTIRLYRHTDTLPENLRLASTTAVRGSHNEDVDLSRDLTVPESPFNPLAPSLPNEPPRHLIPPPPRILITPPTLPVPHLPNLFYGNPEIPESVAWRNGTRPLSDLIDRGALLRDAILPSIIPTDADRWAVWSEEEEKGWKHSEIVAFLESRSLEEGNKVERTVEVDPLELWRVDVFVEVVLLGIYKGQTVVFTRPGGNTPESKL